MQNQKAIKSRKQGQKERRQQRARNNLIQEEEAGKKGHHGLEGKVGP